MAVGDGVDEAVDQLINTASALGSTTIDLSKKRLTHVPPEVLNLQHLEFLYLEGNSISSLPEELFECLPNLRWLDLRNNCLSEIPSIIGKHRNLRNLLLEGNTLESLPLELGLLKSLSGLNLSGNPLEFPPSHIVERGTQEILKFLREQYLLQIQERGGMLVEEHDPDSSSSEELLVRPPHEIEATGEQDKEEHVENERNVRAERFKLPPIFQAAARQKNRTIDESEGLLRGKKARTFEQEKPSRSFVHLDVDREQKSPVRTMKHEAKSPSKDVLFRGAETKEGRVQLKPLEKVRRTNDRRDKKLDLDKNLQIVDTNKDSRKPKSEKVRRRTRTKSKSPQKMLATAEISSSNESVVASTVIEKSESIKERKSFGEAAPGNEIKKPQHPSIDCGGSKGLGSFTLSEGDMVAIKVPQKLYIKGQPCLGKITTLADHQGLLNVHYYTGSYEGRWRPMMSRTSPYLRKVATADVLCKFRLSSDGRMSPITQRKLRTIVDEKRSESSDAT